MSSSNLQIEGLSSNDLYELSIFSASGGFYKNMIIKNLDIVDISDLPQGIYYLKVKGDLKYKTLPFVKI